MELLLWLYLYDRRWFFNIRIKYKIYSILWLGLMLFHMIYLIKLFYKHSVHNFSYTTGFNQIFSLAISFNIIFFLLKLNQEEKKHLSKFTKFAKVFKSSVALNTIKPVGNDYWIRSRTIYSGSGISLLIMSIFSFFKFYLDNQIREEIDFSFFTLQNFFTLFQILIFYSNMFILILAVLLIHFKVFFFAASSICPRVHAKLAGLIHSKKSLQIISHVN